MTSETDICNLALTRLGEPTITSLSASSKGAQLGKLHYARTRDALLRSHPWNFSIKRAELSLASATPAFEFDYAFTLPSDCLKVIRTRWDADLTQSAEYRIEGRTLLSNSDTAAIEYIARITNPDQFDDLFVDLLAQRLAAEISMSITDNQALTKNLWEIYQAKLAEARTTDAQEGTPRDVVDAGDWVLSRL